MPKAYKCLFIVVLPCLLMACQSMVSTDIETFRDERVSFEKGTIKVVPVDKEIEESLEFRHFKVKLEERLNAMGYQTVQDGQSEYRAKLGYGVSRQEKDKPGSRVFLAGQLGYFGYRTHNSILISDSVGSEFEYVRQVTLAIDKPSVDPKKGKVIQVSASSAGRCGYLTEVYDAILDAIFVNLMRADGSIDKVKVKSAVKCR